MTTSLIIATYNWPKALRVCLESIMCQTLMPTEILIADDGSGDATRDIINAFAAISPVPIRHIWHEDTGFRLAAIRNKAIAASKCDYIIQIDGDVIAERHFVQDHVNFARQGYFVGGTRALVDQNLTQKVLNSAETTLTPMSKGIQHKNNAIRFSFLSKLLTSYKPGQVKGCNMGFWRNDLISVNGYDELFEGWGGEDNELADRLSAFGRKKRAMKFKGVVYHLDHPLASRDSASHNRKMRTQNKLELRLRCDQGLSQYLA